MAVLIAIAVALIQCRWTELCYGLTARNLAKLQHNVIQNVAAHIVAYHQPKRPTSSHLFHLSRLASH